MGFQRNQPIKIPQGDSDNDFCEFNIIPIIGNICGIYHVIKFIVYFVI